MNVLNSTALSASFTLPQKRKLDVTSDGESATLSVPSSHQQFATLPRSYRPSSSQLHRIGQRKSKGEGLVQRPRLHSETNIEGANQGLDRTVNQTYHSKPEARWSHRNRFTSRIVFSSPASRIPVARHLRILSQHIRHFQISLASNEGGLQNPEANLSLTRIPSIMDVFLDAKSPSIDFTEEVLLEIADRSRQLSLLSCPGSALASSQTQLQCSHQDCEYRHSANSDSNSSLASEVTGLNLSREQIWFGKNAAHSGNCTRHPDSFERSTASWSEGLNGK